MSFIYSHSRFIPFTTTLFYRKPNPLSDFLCHHRNIAVSLYKLRSSDIELSDDGQESTASKKKLDPSKDRTKVIPVELSLKYMESAAFKTTYGDNLIWQLYRRNHKDQFPPRKTRKSCVRNGYIANGNPCPICRDIYLVVDYRNLKLLKQFISPYTDEVIDPYYTGVCRKQHFNILVAIERARDMGLLTCTVPQRVYDYRQYYGNIQNLI